MKKAQETNHVSYKIVHRFLTSYMKFPEALILNLYYILSTGQSGFYEHYYYIIVFGTDVKTFYKLFSL